MRRGVRNFNRTEEIRHGDFGNYLSTTVDSFRISLYPYTPPIRRRRRRRHPLRRPHAAHHRTARPRPRPRRFQIVVNKNYRLNKRSRKIYTKPLHSSFSVTIFISPILFNSHLLDASSSRNRKMVYRKREIS